MIVPILAIIPTGLALVAPAVAAGLILINLIVFTVWTRPVNHVTRNWTIQLEDWRRLRRQWEYSHAVNAGITFIAFVAVTVAAVKYRSGPRAAHFETQALK